MAETEMIWPRAPHTAAKHQMLEGYLRAWFRILLRRFPGVTYLDGFAGPGEYTGSEPGSPIIALRTAVRRGDVLGMGKPLRFVFIEARRDREEHLAGLLETESNGVPGHVEILCRRGTFEELMQPCLDAVGAWGQPIFANLDAWSVDVPFTHVARIGENPSSEVLVTFVSGFFRRFADTADPEKGDRQFGSTDWRGVAELPPDDRKAFIVSEYRRTLGRAGFPYTLAFEMLDDRGYEVFLVFGTTNERGVEKMKDAMWRVDPVTGVRFRDPRDPAQAELFVDHPEFDRLRTGLLRQLAGGAWVRVEDLRRFTLLETIFRAPHAMQALRQLRDEQRIQQEPGGRLTVESVVRLDGGQA